MVDICECSVVRYVSNDANMGGSALAQHIPDLPADKLRLDHNDNAKMVTLTVCHEGLML